MKIKTSELTGAALDWAVGYAQCLEVTNGKPILARDLMASAIRNGMASPSTNWSQGGPIIEREGIGLLKVENRLPHQQWDAGETDEPPDTLWAVVSGPTPLIAAMRCYVASKLGDEVEVPDELA